MVENCQRVAASRRLGGTRGKSEATARREGSPWRLGEGDQVGESVWKENERGRDGGMGEAEFWLFSELMGVVAGGQRVGHGKSVVKDFDRA